MASLKTTSLDGRWEFVAASWPPPPEPLAYSRMEWLEANVPGHVHRDLHASRIIPDPLTEKHELGCQWIDDEDWIYRRSFDFEPDQTKPTRLLRFEGLDTVCKIFLDGQLIAEHDNMFMPLEVDVSQRLTAGSHELRVEFESAARVGRARRDAYFLAQQIPAHTVRFAERAFVRKAQFMFGWDWGPRLASVGIWRPVQLLEYAARLCDVHLTQRHDADGAVRISFESSIDHPGTSGDPTLEVLHFVQGFERPLSDGEELRIAEPRLWWPAKMGEQCLYEVVSLLVPAGTSPERARDAALHQRKMRVGLRRIELRQERDAHGQSFQFVVNGRELWAVGANWIPDHSFVSAVDRTRLRLQLERAVELNMNMLRIWGGGLYETDEFYELCDELGLLVWQDFPFACSYYPDDTGMQQLVAAEAASNVRRLRNHPSLALWCGNNENHEMFDSGWEGRENNPSRFYGERLYHETLPQVVDALDAARPYVASSPLGGDRPNAGGTGDQHYWDVWHGRGDWVHYQDSTARFSSEFGFASSPGPHTWAMMLPDALRAPVRHDVARWHDKTLKGYETFLGYAALHYPTAETIEEWIYTSQMNQRDALRFGIEHYRRSEFCKGSLVWQLNDCWPAQSWAVIDFGGDYKAAAYELRRLYASALVSLVVKDGQARVWAIYDNAEQPKETDVTLEVFDLRDGSSLATFRKPVKLERDCRKLVIDQDVSRFPATRTLVCARFAGSETYRLLAESKDCVFSQVQLSARRVDGGIEIDADGPLVDLLLFDPSGQTRLLDNVVTLPQGGRRKLRCKGAVPKRLIGRSLAGPVELFLS